MVIVVTSGKGGVGKTTVSANIGACLSFCGKKVLLIDADFGLRNLDIVMGLESSVVYDISDVASKRCSLDDAVIDDSRFDGLSFLAAPQICSTLCLNMQQMSEIIGEAKKIYDFIIIDCPTGIGDGFYSAVSCADSAIVVVTPDAASLRDADRVIGLINERGVEDCSLVVNKIYPELMENGEMFNIDDIIDALGIKLLGVIADDKNILIAQKKGMLISEDNFSKSSEAFKNIAKRLCGEHVPIIDFNRKKSFWKKKSY